MRGCIKSMLVDTKYLGKQDIEEDKIIYFETGIPGFQEEKKFVVLDIPGNDVMQIMQSLQNTNLAFFITNPYHFYHDYSFKLDDSVIDSLAIKDEKEVVIFVIMTIQEPFENSTLNLRAPVIINSDKKIGKQFILNDDDYPLKAAIQQSAKESRE